VQLSHESHAIEIRMSMIRDSILLDGKPVVRRRAIANKSHVFSIPDGGNELVADVRVKADASHNISSVRLIIDGRILYREVRYQD
jgi:hypothetical protein